MSRIKVLKLPKRPKYQAPQPEHPDTKPNITDEQIHANHVEAFNSAVRRKVSAYRRKTNTYAKDKRFLQTRLDTYWVLHNFVRPHFSLKQVPAVVLGCLEKGLSWFELFQIRLVSP